MNGNASRSRSRSSSLCFFIFPRPFGPPARIQQFEKLLHVDRLDGPLCGHRKVPWVEREEQVAGAILPVRNTIVFGECLKTSIRQVLALFRIFARISQGNVRTLAPQHCNAC